MTEELKDSGTVTAMSVVGFVFGMVGMLGSFIPCIGSLAFYIGIPAAIISGIALGIAYSQHAKRNFAIVAVTISLIGVVISGWQFFNIISVGKKANEELQKMSRTYVPSQQQRSPQAEKQYEKPGPQITELPPEVSKSNQDEARKLFHVAYLPLMHKGYKIFGDSKWIKKEILLIRGAANFMQIEMQPNDMYVFDCNKKFKMSDDCGKTVTQEYKPEDKTTGSKDGNWWRSSWQSKPINRCDQYIFEPFYEDTKLYLFLPKDFQNDFKITLRDAKIVN